MGSNCLGMHWTKQQLSELSVYELRGQTWTGRVLQNVDPCQKFLTSPRPAVGRRVHRVKRRHRVYGHDTIATLWI